MFRKMVLDLFILIWMIHFTGVQLACSSDKKVERWSGGVADLTTVTDIPHDVCHITMAYNNFQIVPAGFLQSFPDLEELFLLTNSLNTIQNGAFEGLLQFRVLDLSYNLITNVQPAISNAITLEELNLKSNRLTGLQSRVFEKLVSLKELNLEGNRISHVQAGWFYGMVGLRFLQIGQQSPRLTQIDACAFAGLKLFILRVDYSDLTSLSADMFGDIVLDPPPLLTLFPASNPWHCDSSLCWIKQGNNDGWLHWLFGPIQCSSPPELVGVQWDSITEAQLGCDAAPQLVPRKCEVITKMFERKYNIPGAGQVSVYKEVSGFTSILECAALCGFEKPKCTAYVTKINSNQKSYTCQMITQASLPTYMNEELVTVSLYEKKDTFIFD